MTREEDTGAVQCSAGSNTKHTATLLLCHRKIYYYNGGREQIGVRCRPNTTLNTGSRIHGQDGVFADQRGKMDRLRAGCTNQT